MGIAPKATAGSPALEPRITPKGVTATTKSKTVIFALVSFIMAVYVVTAPPWLSSFRDSGEMVAVLHTLGIAHPPGYPLYSILGKLAIILIPWGNIAYRVHCLSILASCLACGILLRLLEKWGVRPQIAIGIVLAWAFSKIMWTLALVEEMHSLSILSLLILLYLWPEEKKFSPRNFYAIAFLSGLFLGIRVDLLFWGPGLAMGLFFFLRRKNQQEQPNPDITLEYGHQQNFLGRFFLACIDRTRSNTLSLIGRKLSANFLTFRLTPNAKSELKIYAACAFFMLLGATIFFFITIRAQQYPLFNWGEPDTLQKTWDGFLRKSYGSRLDVLSATATTGEFFLRNLLFHLKRMAAETFWLFPLSFWGFWCLWKKDRSRAAILTLAWFFTGPVFIFIANLPPAHNTFDTLEPHFISTLLVLYLWMGIGAEDLWDRIKIFPQLILTSSIIILGVGPLWAHWSNRTQRSQWILYDYVQNCLRSVPDNSILVFHADNHVFAFWTAISVERWKPNVTIVSQLLSRNSWYNRSLRESPAKIRTLPLTSQERWLKLIQMNYPHPVFAGFDVPIENNRFFPVSSWGVLRFLGPEGAIDFSQILLGKIYAYRGNLAANSIPDIVTRSFAIDYGDAAYFFAKSRFKPSLWKRAQWGWKLALSFNPYAPTYYTALGKLHAQFKDWQKAFPYFYWSAEIYRQWYEQSLSDPVLQPQQQLVQKERMNNLLYLGMAAYWLGKMENAEEAFRESLSIQPQAQIYFNLAQVLKNRDPKGYIECLQKCLELNPHDTQAKTLLIEAKTK